MPRSLVRRRDGSSAMLSTAASPCGPVRRRHTGQSSSMLGAATTLVTILAVVSPGAAQFFDEIAEVTTSASLAAGVMHAITWEYVTNDPDREERTTGDLNPFEIELRSCAGEEEACSCGSPYLQLCGGQGGEAGASPCMDSDGSYDVVIPSDVPAGTYVFSVTYLGAAGWSSGSSAGDAGEVTGCSNTFLVEEPAASAPALTAKTPGELQPGDSFTAEWEYDDGEGQGAGGNFEVNLHSCADAACANNSCGTFVSALCGDGGCYDPGLGDYDVRVPATATAGTFKLQVKSAFSGSADAGASDCTDPFDVTEPADNNRGLPTPTPSPVTAAAEPTPAPAPVPTAQPVTAVAPTEAPVAAATAQPVAAAAPPSPAPVATAATAAPAPEPVGGTAPAPIGGGSSLSSDGEGNTPGTPPTPAPERVTCNPAAEVEYNYELETTTGQHLVTISHKSGDRDEGGCTNFTEMLAWLASKPAGVPENLLYPVDPATDIPDTSGGPATGTWLLKCSVDVSNGVLLEVIGTEKPGGDADKVLISSPEVQRLRGSGGHLYFDGTHVTSWLEDTQEPHILPQTSFGNETSEARPYIVCLSEVIETGQICSGVAKKDRGECRMDIIETEMAYLGHFDTESYGITWKVRGLCDDLSNREDLFNTVRVYGDMIGSDIHGMWYGQYSYGHWGGVWTDNIMHDNHIYGFDPHDDSDYLTISRNTCYNNGNHGIIASKRCDHLLVEDNLSYDNGGSGIMLHVSSDDSIVRGNTLRDNVDAGLSLVETSHTTVYDNTISGNKYGIRLILGANDNEISENTILQNTQHDIYLYRGADTDETTVPGNTGTNMRNTIDSNEVTPLTGVKFPLDVTDSANTAITNNVFVGNGAFRFVRSTGTRLSGNSGPTTTASPFVVDSCFTPGSGVTPQCI